MKITKPKLHKLVKKNSDAADTDSGAVPKITADTIADHREEVLGSARKYIYPLQHSKHRIVVITTSLLIAALVFFLTYTILALYQFQSYSTFLYRVTQVLPLPVGKAGSDFVAYENYLFELRHYTHYYENQQELDFDSEAGRQQLAEFKKRALDKVINDTYVKQMAKKYNVTISDREVEDQIAVVRSQGRLGGDDEVLEDVLREYWGWTLNDYKRSLKSQMLSEKIVAVLDTATKSRAESAMNELTAGADFAQMAQKYSDDETTKEAGGNFGFAVDRSTRELHAKTTEVLFKLQPGEISGIINIGDGLEIVKNLEAENGKIRGAHILFRFEEIGKYINDIKSQQGAKTFIRAN